MIEGRNIWYGVQGEGRGHASRSRVLIEELRRQGARVRVFSGGHALEVLGDGPVEPIPLLRFAFRRDGRLAPLRTIGANLGPMRQILHKRSRAHLSLDALARQDPPDFVLSDFEPLLARFAMRRALPWISIDHQHVLTDTRIPSLGTKADLQLRILAGFTRWLVPARCKIVSSFHHFPLRPGSDATLVGCFLRDALRDRRPTDGAHVTVYLKEPGLAELLGPALAAHPDTPFHVWSRGDPVLAGNVQLRAPDPDSFLDDLSGCSWLLTTAGNQLLGEARHLGKPVLAFALPGQTEQRVNAAALDESGCGRGMELSRIVAGGIAEFGSQLDGFRERISGGPGQPASDALERSLEAIGRVATRRGAGFPTTRGVAGNRPLSRHGQSE